MNLEFKVREKIWASFTLLFLNIVTNFIKIPLPV
jgi:hypothetical protein